MAGRLGGGNRLYAGIHEPEGIASLEEDLPIVHLNKLIAWPYVIIGKIAGTCIDFSGACIDPEK